MPQCLDFDTRDQISTKLTRLIAVAAVFEYISDHEKSRSFESAVMQLGGWMLEELTNIAKAIDELPEIDACANDN